MSVLSSTAGEGILVAILSVFTAVGGWLVETVNSLVPMFYSAESVLTFLGVLGVAGLAFSVAFLLIGLIKSWLRFR